MRFATMRVIQTQNPIPGQWTAHVGLELWYFNPPDDPELVGDLAAMGVEPVPTGLGFGATEKEAILDLIEQEYGPE